MIYQKAFSILFIFLWLTAAAQDVSGSDLIEVPRWVTVRILKCDPDSVEVILNEDRNAITKVLKHDQSFPVKGNVCDEYPVQAEVRIRIYQDTILRNKAEVRVDGKNFKLRGSKLKSARQP